MTGHFFTLYHESFKSRDVYALAISHPGQGYSEPYPTSASAKKYVETDMKPFLNGMFGNKNISVIGYSMGSSIAGYMAATMTQVENVGLLASVAPLEPFYEDEIEMNKNLFNVRLLFMHDITRRIYAYLGMNLLHYKRGNVWTSAEVLTTNSANSTIRQLFADDLFRGSALGMDGLLFAFEVMNSDWGFDFDLLSKKNVLIVSGELDDRCNKSIQFFLHQRIRNSRLVTYNGAHSDVLDKLDEYAVDLLKF
ncbi:pimeloyl-[acyl-carrier protein] methyl ester esterase [Acrasis kona]|uniref:Pimeloyl-[acyl-carrier protein] methyl ester esterase n=1 Tax=Acrasis kona TaxID=1008807 RepID=A0AAW2Z892_9EUKA